jgi:hypothetical protein
MAKGAVCSAVCKIRTVGAGLDEGGEELRPRALHTVVVGLELCSCLLLVQKIFGLGKLKVT